MKTLLPLDYANQGVVSHSGIIIPGILLDDPGLRLGNIVETIPSLEYDVP